MDEKIEKLRQCIETADIPAELKVKELALVNDPTLSPPEVHIALTQLIDDASAKILADAGITDVPDSPEVSEATKEFETEVEQVQKDLAADLQLVDDNLKEIQDAAEEIQKVALQADLNA